MREELQAVADSRGETLAKLDSQDLEAIRSDDALSQFATAGGSSLFKVYCSQCHGSGAQGSAGYPNLNDDDWLWGGDLESIYITVKHGVRDDSDDDTRLSDMPAFGADEVLESDEIASIAEYVLKLSRR